jgi:hypothetical protein
MVLLQTGHLRFARSGKVSPTCFGKPRLVGLTYLVWRKELRIPATISHLEEERNDETEGSTMSVKILFSTFRKLGAPLLLASALVLFTAHTTGFAKDNNSAGCRFQGSWIGYDAAGASWLSTAAGQSASSGTYALETPGFDVTFGQSFPAAYASTFRGSWERLDGNTFGATLLAIAVDASGAPVYIAKLSGIDTLSKDCNSMSIVATVELFWGNEDPFEDVPFLVMELPPHGATRLSVDPPAL